MALISKNIGVGLLLSDQYERLPLTSVFIEWTREWLGERYSATLPLLSYLGITYKKMK